MNQRPIVLIEDNQDDAFLMQRAFESAGVQNPVRLIADGEEAIEFMAGPEARDAIKRPRLVLLDLKLPYKTGFDVLDCIRSQPELRGLPVVVLTSSNEPSDIRRALELGANAYVVKPAAFGDIAQLAVAIRDFWLKYHSVAD
jgi:CheY-like chemotaxis protein